jgi:hypothetical protein
MTAGPERHLIAATTTDDCKGQSNQQQRQYRGSQWGVTISLSNSP